jgi:hypothetical protein
MLQFKNHTPFAGTIVASPEAAMAPLFKLASFCWSGAP